jgi:4-diphosphocytidyl-2C-methyl-D-erythritol kinase
MTGSGSAVFAVFPGYDEAERVRRTVSRRAPADWMVLTACTLGEVSLFPAGT